MKRLSVLIGVCVLAVWLHAQQTITVPPTCVAPCTIGLTFSVAPAPPPIPIPAPAPDPSTLPLIQTITRVCSFKLPAGSFNGDVNETFEYGGGALSYNPAHNSLFVGSHVWRRYIAEVTIPACGGTATFLQPFTDPTGGKVPGSITADVNGADRGGSLVVGNLLFHTWYADYGSSVATHLISSTDLTNPTVNGPFAVLAPAPAGVDFASDYMGTIPAAWQALLGGTHLTGNCCKNIISRTSYGPAVLAFTPPTQTPTPKSVVGTPLVYYTGANPLAPESTANTLFNLATRIRGVVFPEDTRSVLFFGRQGATYCYGDTTANGGVCVDPESADKGTHGYPYAYRVWAYDANDLLAVVQKKRQPWSVRPYALIPLTLSPAKATDLYGAAYDAATGRIFVTQAFANGDAPLVQVLSAQ